MRKLKASRCAPLALIMIAGAASAQSDNPWNGIYAGVNAGEVRNGACVSGTLNAASISMPISQICPGSGSFAYGAQVGDDFQYKKLVLGFSADLDLGSTKSQSRAASSSGAAPPAGTYTLSGKLDPNTFSLLGMRIGFASLQWLPYLKVGALITSGSHESTLSYTPAGAVKPTVSFNGGKNFSSAGWAAGGGVEYGFNGPWSISVEYLRANLGKGSNSTATCSGLASVCAEFSGITFDTSHNSFKADIIRIGVNYWFDYW
jgi:outer membrane immunogenic protein